MISYLSQIAPPAGFTGFAENGMYVVVSFTALVVAYKQLTGRSEQTRISPQPLDVREHKEPATREALDEISTQVHGRIKREREEINAALTELREEDRRLRAKLEQEIKDLNQTVDEIPVKTIELLRKTKGLIE